MKVSLISDLHLECTPKVVLPGGDILLMAGDIFTAHPLRDFRQDAASRKLRSLYQKFAEEQLSKYSRVLYVMGNHEHYRVTFQETPGLITDFLKTHAPNTRLLDNETEIIAVGGEQVAVLGTTLWATCCVGHPLDEYRIVNAMRDFQLIKTTAAPPPGMTLYDGRRAFTPRDAYAQHLIAMDFLAAELPKHRRAIVLSHHAPSFESAAGEEHNTQWLDSAYCSDQVDLIRSNPQIEVYGHGHTHRDEDYQIGSTRVLANQHGYPHELMHGRRILRQWNPQAKDFELKEKARDT